MLSNYSFSLDKKPQTEKEKGIFLFSKGFVDDIN